MSFFSFLKLCGNAWKVSHGIEGNDIDLPFPSLVMFPSLDIILRRVTFLVKANSWDIQLSFQLHLEFGTWRGLFYASY
jgi:hypothetical protein